MMKKLKLGRKLLSIALIMAMAFTFSFVSPKLADSTAYADTNISFAESGVGNVDTGYKVKVTGASKDNGMYVVEFTGTSLTVPNNPVGGTFGAVDTAAKSVQYTVKADATDDQINTDLSAIRYEGKGTISITAVKQAPKTVTGASTDVYYNGNGHYYRLVTTAAEWWTAMEASANESNNQEGTGYTGYKAHPLTITSPGENDVVEGLLANTSGKMIWLGAVPSENTSSTDISDNLPSKGALTNTAGSGSAWIWLWNTPEEASETGNVVPSDTNDYKYWHGSEPSGNSSSATYVLYMVKTSDGNVAWDDLAQVDLSGKKAQYVIEYSPYETTSNTWLGDDNNTNAVKTTSRTYSNTNVAADSTASTDTNISFATKGVGDVDNGYTVKVTGATTNNEMYIVEFTGNSLTPPTNPAGGTFGTIDEGTKSVRYTLTTSATNANVNADLSAIKYVGSGEISITAVKQAPKTGDVYYKENGHYYRLVTTAEEWWTAMTNSAADSNNGTSGYDGYKAHPLTITTSGENEVVKALRAKISGDKGKIWLGAVPSKNTSDSNIKEYNGQNSNKKLPEKGYNSNDAKGSGAGWIWLWNTPEGASETGNVVPSDTNDYKYWHGGGPDGSSSSATYVLCMSEADDGNVAWDDLNKDTLSGMSGYKTMQYIIEYSPYDTTWLSDSSNTNVVKKTSSDYSSDNVNVVNKEDLSSSIVTSGIKGLDNKTYNGTAATYTGTATVTGHTDITFEYSWYKSDDTELNEAPKDAGSYYLKVSIPDSNENYTGSAKIDFTISQKEVTVSKGSYKVSKVYDGTADAGTATGTLEVSGIVGNDATVTATPVAYTNANVGGQSNMDVAIALTGNGSANYKIKNDATTISVPCKITKATLTVEGTATASAAYGTQVKNITISGLTAKLDSTTVNGTWSFANTATATPEVGSTKSYTATFTPTEGAGNYNVLTKDITPTITKATYTANAIDVQLKYGNTTTKNITSSIVKGGSIKSITTTNTAGALSEDATYLVNVITIKAANDNTKVKQKATVKITVTSENYKDYDVTLNVEVVDKTPLTVTAPTAKTGLVYNGKAQALVTAGSIKESTHGKISYSLTSGQEYSKTIPTRTNAGTYTVYYEIEGDNDYASQAEKSIPVTIAKQPVTVAPKNVTITKGSALPTTYELAYTGLVKGDTITPSATPEFSLTDKDGNAIADLTKVKDTLGTYSIKWTNEASTTFTGDDNYEVTKNATGTLTVKNASSSGGGGGGSSSTSSSSKLEIAKNEAKADVKTEAEANKYDAEETSEVAAIKAQAEKDIAAAKTVEEVEKIEAEAEAKIEAVLTSEEKAEIKTVKSVDKDVFKAKSKKSKLKGKTAIKITWNVPKGLNPDGFEIYRSVKKTSGFGNKAYFSTTKTSYTNNKNLKAGNTYYYKVRAYKMINGEKVYTGWSTKAYRTIR